jgi:hypothetical protein
MAKRQEIPDILGQERQRINVLDDVLSGKPAGSDTALIRSQLRYDYSLIPEAQRDTVQDAAVEIVRNGQRAQESLITIGQRLVVVKDMLEHGQFSDWCQTEFDMSQRTAQRMMQVADVFGGKSDTVSFLTDSAMYLLSAPSTPEPAREQVIQEAQAAGKSPTKARVQEVISQHRPAVVPSAATGSRQQGAQLATCSMCHRPLSDPASAIAGVGPCCAAKRTTAAGTADEPTISLDELEVVDSITVRVAADGKLNMDWEPEEWEQAQKILTPDRNEPTSAAQMRNERIDSVMRRLNAALDAVSDYEELTGAYTHTPALRRAIEPMLRTLEGNRI